MPWLADRSPTPRMSDSSRGQHAANLLHAGERLGLLDEDLDPDAPDRQPELHLQLGEERVDEPHVARCLHLRDDHDVEVGPGALHDGGEIVGAPVRVGAVDANAPRLRAPVELVQGGDDRLAGLLLLGRGDGVLEVEEHQIGGAGRRLHDHLLARAGCRQLRAAQAGGPGHRRGLSSSGVVVMVAVAARWRRRGRRRAAAGSKPSGSRRHW